jgi:hypothetical protein
MGDGSWLARQLEGAPGDLAARTTLFAADALHGAPDALALAGGRALGAAIRQASERQAALDLLAADALVTLALAAQAERDPAALEAFARALRQADTGLEAGGP